MSRYSSPAAASIAASLIWVVLAWRTPTSTHHFAPLVAAAAFGVVLRSTDHSPGARDGVVSYLGGLVAPLLGLVVLIAANKLQGPTLFESIAVRPELILSAVIGATIGSRPWSWLVPTPGS